MDAAPAIEAPDERHLVAITLNLPRFIVYSGELQVEVCFTEDFSLALQGGYGRPEIDRERPPDLTLEMFTAGAQARGYFAGSSDSGGFAGVQFLYVGGTLDDADASLFGVGGAFIGGYKWGFDFGLVVDLTGGVGYGYAKAKSDSAGEDGSGSSFVPVLNINLGWAI